MTKPSQGWREKALCDGLDPELFYSENSQDSWYALRVCINCPVRIDCLEDALRFADTWGTRGGTLQRDRRSSSPFLFRCRCGSLTNRRSQICRACHEAANPKKYQRNR